MHTAARCAFAALAWPVVAAAQQPPDSPHVNLTAGGPLRPGVYGRIEVRGAPPPLIYARPTVAGKVLVPADARPVFLYVPPGQVRRWQQHCARWSACDEPVLFVRMDESPSRWGRWRHLREQVALQDGRAP